MAVDIPRLKRVLQQAIIEKLGDEVDLIIFCGSRLTHTTHRYSDIDLMYVPQHESTWDAITVLVDSVMVDLYAVHWSRLLAIAEFDDPSSGVLLNHEVVYARESSVSERLKDLVETMHRNTQPERKRHMVRKAMDSFQQLMYEFYLLQSEATQADMLSAMIHAQRIMKGVLHSLSVLNQRCVDIRKRDQVMSLPKLPRDCAHTLDTITTSTSPPVLLRGCRSLLDGMRDLLVAEQANEIVSQASLQDVLDSAYPELKNDLQHILLACETRDTFNFSLMSLYHELMIHMSQALNGVEYTGFNTVSEYRQDLQALGFPDLLPYVTRRDFDGLFQATQEFDQALQRYLSSNNVSLNAYDSLDDLVIHLENG